MDTAYKNYGNFEIDMKNLPGFFNLCDKENRLHDLYVHLKDLIDQYGFGRVEQAVKDINLPRT